MLTEQHFDYLRKSFNNFIQISQKELTPGKQLLLLANITSKTIHRDIANLTEFAEVRESFSHIRNLTQNPSLLFQELNCSDTPNDLKTAQNEIVAFINELLMAAMTEASQKNYDVNKEKCLEYAKLREKYLTSQLKRETLISSNNKLIKGLQTEVQVLEKKNATLETIKNNIMQISQVMDEKNRVLLNYVSNLEKEKQKLSTELTQSRKRKPEEEKQQYPFWQSDNRENGTSQSTFVTSPPLKKTIALPSLTQTTDRNQISSISSIFTDIKTWIEQATSHLNSYLEKTIDVESTELVKQLNKSYNEALNFDKIDVSINIQNLINFINKNLIPLEAIQKEIQTTFSIKGLAENLNKQLNQLSVKHYNNIHSNKSNGQQTTNTSPFWQTGRPERMASSEPSKPTTETNLTSFAQQQFS